MSKTFEMWNKLSGVPGGNRVFSAALSLKAPYFRTVTPTVTVMEPGHAEVTSPKWWGVHNHIGTFHAIATCNLAEVAMGMLAEATVPDTHRWLPRGMEVAYVAKAETSLRAIAEVEELPAFGDEPFDIPVKITVVDKNDKPVTTGTITIYITRKK